MTHFLSNLTEYIKIKSADYKAMDPVDILRMNHDEKYATLTPEEREILWEEEVVNKFYLDRTQYPETDRTAQAGLIRLRLEADKLRQEKIAYQESFGEPQYVDPVDTSIDKTLEELNSSPEMTALLQSKTLPFQFGDKAVWNLRVDNPDDISQIFIDPAKFADVAFDENDRPQVQRMLLAGAMLKDPQLVIKGIFEAGVAAGRNNQYEVIEDAQPFGQQNPPTGPEETIAQAFKNRGVLRGGGE
jgi:hypothetical protein